MSIYTDIVVSYAHEVICMYGMYVAFEEHLLLAHTWQ